MKEFKCTVCFFETFFAARKTWKSVYMTNSENFAKTAIPYPRMSIEKGPIFCWRLASILQSISHYILVAVKKFLVFLELENWYLEEILLNFSPIPWNTSLEATQSFYCATGRRSNALNDTFQFGCDQILLQFVSGKILKTVVFRRQVLKLSSEPYIKSIYEVMSIFLFEKVLPQAQD